MFKIEQIENQMDIPSKRSYNMPLAIVPTSILIAQTLAKLKFQRIKKSKASLRSRENYQFK